MWRRALPLLAVLAGLVAAVVFLVVGLAGRPHPVDRGAVPAAASRGPATRSSEVRTTAAPPAGVLPTGLTIPQLSVRAAVVPVAVGAGGALGVPDDIGTVGWWEDGALPGSTTGTVVLDGHVDSAVAGDGALFGLRHLAVGASVVVSGDGPTVDYRVTGLREYDKDDLPAASLFVRSGPPRLVIVTCGGPFDAATRHYRDNVVAFGVPVTG